MSLRTTNLNLLPILRALLREGSVTRAADTLGLSQPATSNALARLREVLGDPLLVPVGRAMRLTPRAEQLRPAIDTVCDAIEALLLDTVFIPAQASQRFIVATPDYLASVLGPPLLQRFQDVAPGISVMFTDVGPDFRRELMTGEIDVAIIANIDELARPFRVRAGYLDRLVGVVAADHPLASNPPDTAEALCVYPRIGLDLGLHGTPAVHELAGLAAYNSGPPALSASHIRVLPTLIAQTAGVAIMPEAFARQAAQLLPVAYFDLPDPAPPLDMCIMWSPVFDGERAHRWFHEELDAVMRRHFTWSTVPEHVPDADNRGKVT